MLIAIAALSAALFCPAGVQPDTFLNGQAKAIQEVFEAHLKDAGRFEKGEMGAAPYMRVTGARVAEIVKLAVLLDAWLKDGKAKAPDDGTKLIYLVKAHGLTEALLSTAMEEVAGGVSYASDKEFYIKRIRESLKRFTVTKADGGPK